MWACAPASVSRLLGHSVHGSLFFKTRVGIHRNVYTHVCTHIYAHFCTHVCTNVYTPVCAHVYIHVYTHRASRSAISEERAERLSVELDAANKALEQVTNK